MKKSVNVVIADRQGRILVLRRNLNDDIYPRFWDLPGGGVKNNETLHKAAKREVAEESGLEIKLEKDYFYTFVYPDGEINYIFRANLISGNVALSQEHIEFKWVTKADWKNLKYTPDVWQQLKDF